MGVRCVDENELSHHFLEDVAVHQETAEKSEGTGREEEDAQASHLSQGGHPEGCHLTSGDSLLPRTLKGPSSSILL